jgi:hypothetical protein
MPRRGGGALATVINGLASGAEPVRLVGNARPRDVLRPASVRSPNDLHWSTDPTGSERLAEDHDPTLPATIRSRQRSCTCGRHCGP